MFLSLTPTGKPWSSCLCLCLTAVFWFAWKLRGSLLIRTKCPEVYQNITLPILVITQLAPALTAASHTLMESSKDGTEVLSPLWVWFYAGTSLQPTDFDHEFAQCLMETSLSLWRVLADNRSKSAQFYCCKSPLFMPKLTTLHLSARCN